LPYICFYGLACLARLARLAGLAGLAGPDSLFENRYRLYVLQFTITQFTI